MYYISGYYIFCWEVSTGNVITENVINYFGLVRQLCTENKVHHVLYWKQETRWATIMHLNTSFWNEAHADNDNDVEYSPPVKYPKILFSGFRKELSCSWSRNCLSQLEATVAILVFSNEPEKHKLGRWLWDLASCQVLLNSIQQFQRSQKCLSLLEARAANLVFWSARNTQTW